MPFGFTHKPLVALANSAICSFFREIEVHGAENVPVEGPIIFACTHANMAIDPAVLSNTVPHGHLLHYWVKDSLFKNPAVGWLLRNAGNIAVDRKTKNNQMLFRGTFEALARGESIGVFPEGTSHTEPHLITLKDGTSWAALEYVRYLQGTDENQGAKHGKKAVVVPVGIAYVDKAKYRSRVVVHYGKPISMDKYEAEFLSDEPGLNKQAVKRLTRDIEQEFKETTVNAPDWDTALAAQMARELLWERENDLRLGDYVQVSQTLVDLFTTSHSKIDSLKLLLATYQRLLTSSRLSNAALVGLKLPRQLHPSTVTSLPSRFSALGLLIKDSLACALRLPFFFVPMLLHLPMYFVGVYGASLVEDEMETQAQMKVTFGLILSFLTYPVLFFALWGLIKHWAVGAAVAALAVWGLGGYHSALIDENYTAMKRLAAAWRLVIGLWLPRDFEMPLPSFIASYRDFAPDPPKVAGLPPTVPPEVYKKPQRLSSRVLGRHVLRVRAQAASELASLLLELEQTNASVGGQAWLVEEFGGHVSPGPASDVEGAFVPRGFRFGKEVVGFLRQRGARLGFATSQDAGAETE